MLGRVALPALTALAVACASSESVDDGPPGGAAGANSGGAAGESSDGGGGVPSSGGFPSGGGFPGGAAGVGGAAGTSAGGSGGTSCGPELCNGLDDDCNGTPDNGACSPGCTGKTYQDHGYAYCATARTLSKAAEDCIAQKMKPARPNDAAENDWLRTTATTLTLASFWLGATDWTTEGTWVFPDGTTVWTGGPSGAAAAGQYVSWAPGEPKGSGGNDCMQMDTAGQWHEVSCTGTAAYVCEDY